MDTFGREKADDKTWSWALSKPSPEPGKEASCGLRSGRITSFEVVAKGSGQLISSCDIKTVLNETRLPYLSITVLGTSAPQSTDFDPDIRLNSGQHQTQQRIVHRIVRSRV